MIKENQRTLNYINVILDALLIFLCMPIAYWARFFLFPFDDRGITLRYYLILTLCMLPIFLITLGAMNLYDSLRTKRLHWEVGRLFWACSINFVVLQTILFLIKQFYFSRLTFVLYFVLVFFALSGKRLVLRLCLRKFRKQGFNQKHVLLLGRVMSGKGGDIILDTCKQVLADEYPELNGKMIPALPDEKFRRVGQSMAAASLPERK